MKRTKERAAPGLVPNLAPNLAPGQVAGFRATGKDRRYVRREIYDYLDGGAEAYLEYGFRELLVREYAGGGAGKQPRRMTLLIFDMGSGPEAYGVYSLEREGPSAGVGQDSDLDEGLLRFWRGRYFVTVTGEGASRAAMLALGRAVAGAIRPRGRRPAVVGWLPPEGLDPASVRYLHTHPWLARQVTLPSAKENLLGLHRGTRAALGRYGEGEARRTLVLVAYPDASGARRARGRLAALPAASRGALQARACGRALALVLGGVDKGRQALLRQAMARIPECKDVKQSKR